MENKLELKIEVKDMKKMRKAGKTLATFQANLSVGDEPLVNLPKYSLYQDGTELKVGAAIHKTIQPKEGEGNKRPTFLRCYYPHPNLNAAVLVEAEKAYQALLAKEKEGK